MLTPQIVDSVVSRALQEDSPWGDVTGEQLIPETAQADAALAAREPGVFSARQVFETVFRQVDPAISVEFRIGDGEGFEAGQELARITGPARPVLRGERVALNLVQRLSGISTLTARYVTEVEGTEAKVTDTRKTTPGLRALEKYAVTAGGGHNHRFSLSDGVLVKDNHLAVLAEEGRDLTGELRALRERIGHTTHIEVEVDRIDQIEAVLAAKPDTIMLDNFTPDQLREGVRLIGGRALVEASGNVSLKTIGEIARTGVDLISVGALTHSVRALDLGLDIRLHRP